MLTLPTLNVAGCSFRCSAAKTPRSPATNGTGDPVRSLGGSSRHHGSDGTRSGRGERKVSALWFCESVSLFLANVHLHVPRMRSRCEGERVSQPSGPHQPIRSCPSPLLLRPFAIPYFPARPGHPASEPECDRSRIRAGAGFEAGRRARILTLELPPGCGRSHDPTAGVACAGVATAGRARSGLAAPVGRGARLSGAHTCPNSGRSRVAGPGSVRAGTGCERSQSQNETNKELHTVVNAARGPFDGGGFFTQCCGRLA